MARRRSAPDSDGGSGRYPIDFRRASYWRCFNLNTPDHRCRPALYRALRDLLWNEAGTYRPDTGVLVQNSISKDRAIETLVRGLGSHPDESSDVAKYITLLLEDGFFAWKEARKGKKTRFTLWIPSFVPAQNAVRPDTQRVRVHRAKVRGEALQRDLVNRSQDAAATQQTGLFTGPSTGVTGNVPGNVSGNEQETYGNVTRTRNIDREIERDRERDLHARAEGWLGDPLEGGARFGTPREWPEVHAVLAHFNELFRQQGRFLNDRDPALLAIVERLAEGFTVPQLLEAIAGARSDPWLLGKPRAQRVAFVLHDRDRVEGYRRILDPPLGLHGGAPRKRVQPTDAGNYQGWAIDAAAESELEGEGEAASSLDAPPPLVPIRGGR